MKTPRTWIGLLLTVLLLGCEHPAPVAPPPFAVEVTQGTSPDSVPPLALTGGASPPPGSFVPDQLLVEVTDPKALEGFAAVGEARFERRFVGIEVPPGMSLAEAHAELAARPGVVSLDLNWRHQLTASYSVPVGAQVQEQWSHRQTEALALWSSPEATKDIDASKVIVAVLDTGIDATHPEFAGRIVAPQNFTADASGSIATVTDGNGHGTHVSGIIAASGQDGQGVAGVAWDARIMPVKVMNDQGTGTDLEILQGFAYALGEDVDGPDPEGGSNRKRYLDQLGADAAARVRVISVSLNSKYHGRRPAYDHAIGLARERGILVVVSAGNDGSEVASPATSPHALAVSATSALQIGDQLWEWLSGFSNRGSRIDLAAPGGQILSTYKGGTYALMSGTSMACPYVAGTAALVVAQHDPAHARQDGAFHDRVRRHLLETADDLGAPGWDPQYGWGRVNVRRAVSAPLAP